MADEEKDMVKYPEKEEKYTEKLNEEEMAALGLS